MDSASSDGVFTGYKTLKEGQIRLLNLQPRCNRLDPMILESSQLDSLSVEIECWFSLTNLDDPLPFEALSYTWGNPDAHIPIKLDGQLVKITKNLDLALQYLRLDHAPRTLWVDALCINQLDVNERNQQVAAMRYVYEKATGVVIFLGEAWDGHEIAIEFLQLMSQSDYHYDPSLTPHITVRGHDITSDRLREEIIHFFQLPWWDRIWVVQEFVLAKGAIFQVGNTLIAESIIRQTFENAGKHYWTCCCSATAIRISSPTYGVSMADAIRRINTFYHMRSFHMLSSQYNINMLRGLALCRRRKAYDDRDKIYGLLGMHFKLEIDKLEPKYEMSAKQLYTEFATRHIRQTDTLDVLNHAGYLNEGGLDVPSYVPDWTAPISQPVHTALVSRETVRLAFYNATQGRPAQFKVLGDGGISLKGVIVDKIAVVGSVHGTDTNSLAFICECLQIRARRLAGHESRAQSERGTTDIDVLKQELTKTPRNDSDEQLWRTVSGNIRVTVEEQLPKIRKSEPKEDMADYLSWRTWITEEQPPGLPPSKGAAAFQQAVQVNTVARKFVVTDNGLIALAPSTSSNGDVIALLYGGKTPFVLRPKGRSTNMENGYELIGDTYIDGIMQEEAVKAWLGNSEMDFSIY
jgi:hypothetical protein